MDVLFKSLRPQDLAIRGCICRKKVYKCFWEKLGENVNNGAFFFLTDARNINLDVS